MSKTETNDRRLLCVVAHPDDETFGCGGTLAKYASEGVRVVLVCGTRGEVGEISVETLANGDNLGEVRERELRAAAKELGVNEVHVLGYRDSGMAGTDDNNHPNAFSGASEDEVVEKVVGIIRDVKPNVVTTFDKNGGYGHPDHIMAHKVTMRAFDEAADSEQYPDQLSNELRPHQAQKLYNFGFTKSSIREFREALRETRGEEAVEDFDEDGFGMPDELVTTVLDVKAHGPAKERAAAQHRTQISGGKDPFDWLPDKLKEAFLSTEYLMRVHPEVATNGGPMESDLFEGV